MESMTVSSMMVLGGPTPDFVNLDPKYKCIKCMLVLKQPRQLPCGHRICRLCIEQLFSASSNVICPSGEEDCNNKITPDQVLSVHICMYSLCKIS
jgi:hypothetical protein